MVPLPDKTMNLLRDRRFHYDAVVVEVIDGDTCVVDIDLGLSNWVRGERVRLHRIDAPELRGPTKVRGASARDFLKEILLGKAVVLVTIKDRREKYGRYLGEVWVEQDGQPPLNASDAMVQGRHAKYATFE